MSQLRVIIGADESEPRAVAVAVDSLQRVSGIEAEILRTDKLRNQGLLTRPEDVRGGQRWDFVSNAPCSTEFSNSRFLVPIIAQSGPVLFVDCDVVFLCDPREMLAHNDWRDYAVQVVKHRYLPSTSRKMGSQLQTRYSRKNWSSVMLFNCDHEAHHELSLWAVNNRTGRDLHNFCWLRDSEIGSLDPKWNWLVGEQPKPDDIGIAHFTLGGPFTTGWNGAPHDDIWLEASQKL